MARSLRAGSTVAYTLATPDVAQLLLSGRRILASMWAGYEGLLAEFFEAVEPK